ncbi:aldo/keto reductase [Cohnella sp. REN36]|uniref:aldo/keto reductase n=1 Tax=Cohnella sp. REN36 TaxID=2887347 RepID=UPI001D158C61|nr:aldo/keto reductase [Cohnella sp. REN36]MCC3376565.1 aldo/keto reductase [Cohnella sp. REN36]
MEYRSLGNSGLKVSALGLGTNAFGKRSDRDTSIRIVHQALDSGITFIDTANIYAGTASETIIREALRGRRQDAVLATKAGLVAGFGPNDRGSSRFHLQRELDASLKRLQTDYVDLYQIHTFDPYTPLEETLRTLDDFVRSGKVRYIGASNYAAWELMKAIGMSERLGLNRFVSTQTSYSLADRTPEAELVPMCLDQGVGIIPYFPLAGGILTGKYAGMDDKAPAGSRADTDPGFQRFLEKRTLSLGEEVLRIAETAGFDPAVLSVAWLMQQPAVSTVIVGATKSEQLSANLQSAELKLDESTLEALRLASDPFRYGEPFAVYRLP